MVRTSDRTEGKRPVSVILWKQENVVVSRAVWYELIRECLAYVRMKGDASIFRTGAKIKDVEFENHWRELGVDFELIIQQFGTRVYPSDSNDQMMSVKV